MTRQKYTDEQLLLDYLNASNKAGRWIKASEINSHKSLANYITYIKRLESIENTQRLIIEKFSDLLEFTAEVSIYWKKRTNKKILEAIISHSISTGHKLTHIDIDLNKYLPSYGTIFKRIGNIKYVYFLASKMSEEFAKLPKKPHASKNERNDAVIEKYIKSCLERNYIIPLAEINSATLGFSKSYIYPRFGSINNFRLECAKVNPKFAELLARHNQK